MKKMIVKKIILSIAVLFFLSIGRGTVLAESVNPFAQGFIEGYLRNISAGTEYGAGISSHIIQVESYDGILYEIEMVPGAALSIDQLPADINAFKISMEIYGELRGNRLISLESYSTANMAYIAPGSKFRTGMIEKIDRNQLQLFLDTGEEMTCYLGLASIVMRNGENVGANTLYEGDRVRIFFDDLDSKIISRIEVEGNSIIIQDIYRAELRYVDSSEDRVSLADIKVLRNGKWADYKESWQLDYNRNKPLYMGKQKVAYQNLKYYCNKDVYIAVSNVLGEDYIEKMVIKGRYESIYSDKIKDINWYTGSLELKNLQNVDFYKGSIIIKNGRLLDQYALNASADVLLVADEYYDQKIASVINVLDTGINNSNIGQYRIYAGEVEHIFKNRLDFAEFYYLESNEWVSFDKEEELYFGTDTAFYDLDLAKEITYEEFCKNEYEDYFIYAFSDGERILAAILKEKNDLLLKQRTSFGIITEINNDATLGWTAKLKDVGDWSKRKEQWILRTNDLSINLGKILIIKENKTITAAELQRGDRLYLIRDNAEVKIVVVK